MCSGWALHRTAAQGTEAAAIDPYAAFCVTVPAAAVVDAATRADIALGVRVPATPPLVPTLDDKAGAPVQVVKGQVLELRVQSPRPGAVAVHGLSELVRLQPDQVGVVRFRAIYTGRFPLHFHGADGSHFEIAVLEIRNSVAGLPNAN